MNILHHKSWHVRTKENIRRVRKDEAKAAEDERRELERQLNVQNERRLTILRSQAEERMDNMFASKGDAVDTLNEEGPSGAHINLFQDLEREERKNLGFGNEDYKKDKEKEKEEWETKMGILVKLGQDTNELSNKKEWYATISRGKTTLSKPERLVYPTSIQKAVSKDIDEERSSKRKRDKDQKKDKKKKKKKKRSKTTDSDDSDREVKRRKEKEQSSSSSRLAELREERLRREREEKERSWRVMHPELAKREDEKKEREKPKYSSGFNPHLARNKR